MVFAARAMLRRRRAGGIRPYVIVAWCALIHYKTNNCVSTQVDMEKLADGLQKLGEEDLLQVVTMIHDNKTGETYTKNDVESESLQSRETDIDTNSKKKTGSSTSTYTPFRTHLSRCSGISPPRVSTYKRFRDPSANSCVHSSSEAPFILRDISLAIRPILHNRIAANGPSTARSYQGFHEGLWHIICA